MNTMSIYDCWMKKSARRRRENGYWRMGEVVVGFAGVAFLGVRGAEGGIGGSREGDGEAKVVGRYWVVGIWIGDAEWV